MIPYNCEITGRIIRDLRIRQNLSQEVLSGLAGVARSYLAMIEAGTKNANGIHSGVSPMLWGCGSAS